MISDPRPAAVRLVGIWPAVALAALLFLPGCASTQPDRAERMERGYVYYLDGAGGGKLLTNWSGGVRDGLTDAGYDGAGEMFSWETGMGVVADQVASESFKRQKAAELVDRICAFHREHPNSKISLVGLSAGTVIAVFALEALPMNVPIDNVVLLSGSLSANHDLSAALRRVRGKMYITSSTRDTVLEAFLPLTGTADRAAGTNDTIGADGPEMPPGASAATRALYAERIVEVPWNPEFEAYGDFGAHTDTVKRPFVQHVVSAFINPRNPAKAKPAEALPPGKAANPDHARWAKFGVGAWVSYEGSTAVDGATSTMNARATLVTKTDSVVLVQRDISTTGKGSASAVLPRDLFVTAGIDPKRSPFTHPDRIETELPRAKIEVKGRTLDCRVVSVKAKGEFLSWGKDVEATVHLCDQVPGHIVKLELVTHLNGREVRVNIRLADFG